MHAVRSCLPLLTKAISHFGIRGHWVKRGLWLATGTVLRALMESSLGAKIQQFSTCSFLLYVLHDDVIIALKYKLNSSSVDLCLFCWHESMCERYLKFNHWNKCKSWCLWQRTFSAFRIFVLLYLRWHTYKFQQCVHLISEQKLWKKFWVDFDVKYLNIHSEFQRGLRLGWVENFLQNLMIRNL